MPRYDGGDDRHLRPARLRGLAEDVLVPGLPLGFLDHNLAIGNSLTGIGTLSEIDDYLPDGSLASTLIRSKLEEVQPMLERMANVNDASIKDVELARKAENGARNALEPLIRILDLIILDRAPQLLLFLRNFPL